MFQRTMISAKLCGLGGCCVTVAGFVGHWRTLSDFVGLRQTFLLQQKGLILTAG
jgi:hypothetical protein